MAPHSVIGHGRATPLIWLTVGKDELKNQRNDFEDACLYRLKETLPEGVAVTTLADRGFGDVKLFAFLQSLGFDYAIRFRSNIHATAVGGETRLAADRIGKCGRARMFAMRRSRRETSLRRLRPREGHERALVYRHQPPRQPDSRNSAHCISPDPQQRDRLLLLSALAVVLSTLLAAAGESVGIDGLLKSNTSKRRTHSLFRQGCLLYVLIPKMPETRFRTRVEKCAQMLKRNSPFTQMFGFV